MHEVAELVVVGHPAVFRQAIRAGWQRSATFADADEPSSRNVIPCLPVGSDEILDVPHGRVDGRTGHAAYEAVVRAIDETREGNFAGIVTAPVSKAALHAAGHFYPGHTELLGRTVRRERFRDDALSADAGVAPIARPGSGWPT